MYPRALLVSLILTMLSAPAIAAEPTAADLLPGSVVAYAEISAPSRLVDAVRHHPLRKTLEALPEHKALTAENPDYLKARAGVGIFEFVAKRKWHEAIDDAAGDGLFFAVDAKTKGAIALAHAPDEGRLNQLRDRLLKAARDDAERKGKAAPFEERDYRGQQVYKADKALVGTIGRWLFVTNKPELGRAVADNLLDGGQDVLAGKEAFQAARKSIAGKPAAWAYVDVKTLREAGVAKAIYKDKSDNFGVELLIGGILTTLKDASTATAAVYLEDERLRVAVNVPHDPAVVPEEKEFYFGKEGQGAAPVALTPKNALAAITSYRDVGEMWRRRSDLFNENVNAQLAKTDSNLSTVFAGLDFGREVLGALQPQVQVISTAQEFKDRKTRVPNIKLPATALVFQLKEPEKMRRQLKVSFQSLVGLTNLGAGQNELPQLELKTEQTDDGQLISATYENLADDAEVSNDIIYNFSPSLAFVGDYFIVSSTRELAVELMSLAKAEEKPPADRTDRIVNTKLTINSDSLRKVLEDNRETLIAQNMLEKGHAREAAEKEIGALFTLLKLMGDASVELATSDHTLSLELSVGLATK